MVIRFTITNPNKSMTKYKLKEGEKNDRASNIWDDLFGWFIEIKSSNHRGIGKGGFCLIEQMLRQLQAANQSLLAMLLTDVSNHATSQSQYFIY